MLYTTRRLNGATWVEQRMPKEPRLTNISTSQTSRSAIPSCLEKALRNGTESAAKTPKTLPHRQGEPAMVPQGGSSMYPGAGIPSQTTQCSSSEDGAARRRLCIPHMLHFKDQPHEGTSRSTSWRCHMGPHGHMDEVRPNDPALAPRVCTPR